MDKLKYLARVFGLSDAGSTSIGFDWDVGEACWQEYRPGRILIGTFSRYYRFIMEGLRYWMAPARAQPGTRAFLHATTILLMAWSTAGPFALPLTTCITGGRSLHYEAAKLSLYRLRYSN